MERPLKLTLIIVVVSVISFILIKGMQNHQTDRVSQTETEQAFTAVHEADEITSLPAFTPIGLEA